MNYSLTFDFFPAQYYPTCTSGANFQNRIDPASTVPSFQSGPINFLRLVEQTTKLMNQQRAISETIPNEFSKRMSLNAKMTLIAKEWTLQSGSQSLGQLRMVHIQGAKNAIINTWVFPNRPAKMPVFAAELIAVGNATKVAFVDIQVPVLSKFAAEDVALLTTALSTRFSSLPCNETPPDWATNASQGNFTYARDVPNEQLSTVEDCYLSYLGTYLRAFASDEAAAEVANSERDEEAIDALQEYQVHHMEHSPGNKFLDKLFGSEWTESFMKNFLFAKPRG
jgi:Ferredoxin-dependent bilin reductase